MTCRHTSILRLRLHDLVQAGMEEEMGGSGGSTHTEDRQVDGVGMLSRRSVASNLHSSPPLRGSHCLSAVVTSVQGVAPFALLRVCVCPPLGPPPQQSWFVPPWGDAASPRGRRLVPTGRRASRARCRAGLFFTLPGGLVSRRGVFPVQLLRRTG